MALSTEKKEAGLSVESELSTDSSSNVVLEQLEAIHLGKSESELQQATSHSHSSDTAIQAPPTKGVEPGTLAMDSSVSISSPPGLSKSRSQPLPSSRNHSEKVCRQLDLGTSVNPSSVAANVDGVGVGRQQAGPRLLSQQFLSKGGGGGGVDGGQENSGSGSVEEQKPVSNSSDGMSSSVVKNFFFYFPFSLFAILSFSLFYLLPLLPPLPPLASSPSLPPSSFSSVILTGLGWFKPLWGPRSELEPAPETSHQPLPGDVSNSSHCVPYSCEPPCLIPSSVPLLLLLLYCTHSLTPTLSRLTLPPIHPHFLLLLHHGPHPFFSPRSCHVPEGQQSSSKASG